MSSQTSRVLTIPAALAAFFTAAALSCALGGCSMPNVQIVVTPGDDSSLSTPLADLADNAGEPTASGSTQETPDAPNPNTPVQNGSSSVSSAPAQTSTAVGTDAPAQAGAGNTSNASAQTSTGGAFVPSTTADLASFKEGMLQRGIEENRVNPRFNPYWEVVDFTFRMNRSDPSAPYPDHMRYVYATPEGITAHEDSIGQMKLYLDLSGHSRDIYVMHRTDSEGTPYLRSTADVEGVGVVDIAYYEGYSNSWYIASTGQAIGLDTDGVWRPFGDPDAEPWTPYFFG